MKDSDPCPSFGCVLRLIAYLINPRTGQRDLLLQAVLVCQRGTSQNDASPRTTGWQARMQAPTARVFWSPPRRISAAQQTLDDGHVNRLTNGKPDGVRPGLPRHTCPYRPTGLSDVPWGRRCFFLRAFSKPANAASAWHSTPDSARVRRSPLNRRTGFTLLSRNDLFESTKDIQPNPSRTYLISISGGVPWLPRMRDGC